VEVVYNALDALDGLVPGLFHMSLLVSIQVVVADPLHSLNRPSTSQFHTRLVLPINVVLLLQIFQLVLNLVHSPQQVHLLPVSHLHERVCLHLIFFKIDAFQKAIEEVGEHD